MLYNHSSELILHQPTIFICLSDFLEDVVKKQPEITERTRQNLVDAFWSLYSTKRIDNITVREITSKAGYNRGTFYEYFRDVYDVLEYIEDQSLPTIEELPPWKEMDDNSPDFFASFLEIYREKFRYYQILLGEKGDPAFQRKLKDNLKSSIIDSISQKGRVDMVEVDLILEYILSGMIGILIYSFEKKPDMSDEQLMSTLYRLFNEDLFNKLRALMT
jgi:AcrR family transcriptional regulator